MQTLALKPGSQSPLPPALCFLQLGKSSKTGVKHTHNLASLRLQWCNYPSGRQEIGWNFLLLIILTTPLPPKDLFLRDCYYRTNTQKRQFLHLPTMSRQSISHPFAHAFLTGQELQGQHANVLSTFSESHSSPVQAKEPRHLLLDVHFPSEKQALPSLTCKRSFPSS